MRRSGVRSWPRSCVGQPLERGFQVALGVDQEIGGGHHHVSVADAVLDLDVSGAAAAEPDLARLEASFATLDEHDLPVAAVDDRAVGNRDYLLGAAGIDFDLGI